MSSTHWVKHDWDIPAAAKRKCSRCGVMQRPNPNGKRRHGKGTHETSRDGGKTWVPAGPTGPCVEKHGRTRHDRA